MAARAGHVDAGVIGAGLGLRAGLRPGLEVFGAGAPGQEPFQCRAGERFPAVAAAFVEVSGEIGDGVQPGLLRGGGDGPGHGGVAGGVAIAGAAGNAAVTWTVTATAQKAGLNAVTYLTAYLDECGRNGGKPLARPALERFLPWSASPEEPADLGKAPAPQADNASIDVASASRTPGPSAVISAGTPNTLPSAGPAGADRSRSAGSRSTRGKSSGPFTIRRLTCPSVPGGSCNSSSKLTCHASARFRAPAQGPGPRPIRDGQREEAPTLCPFSTPPAFASLGMLHQGIRPHTYDRPASPPFLHGPDPGEVSVFHTPDTS